jgi:beta-phosphoglucomutase-like phosphatase (HAD superfamily)
VTPSAVVFDFNGTLSDDEPIMYAVYAELFAEQGRPITERRYYDELAGHTEEEIMRRWLGRDDPELVAERIARYLARAVDGETISEEVREAVRYAAARVPVAIVSGAALEEIAPVVAAAGLAPVIPVIVAADHVADGKPHPEGYLRAAELLGVPPVEIVAFEDTEVGVASAKAAGMRCVGITRTLGAARLARADELIPELDLEAVRRVLACS